MKPGAIVTMESDIILNEGKETKSMVVANVGDRPIQVGSHFHFFEVNKFLHFNRKEAFGFRLDIPSGTSVRFEPGEEKEVQLVRLGGRRTVYGCNDLTRMETSSENLEKAWKNAVEKGMVPEEEGEYEL